MLVVILASVVFLASAKCPAVKVFQSFNASLYLGQWYEIAASPLIRETFERNCFCTNARYGLNSNATVSVRNSCNKGGPQGKPSIIEGWAAAGTGSDAAKLRVHLDGHGGNYWVMYVGKIGKEMREVLFKKKTEVNANGVYDNAIVWSCESVVVNLELRSFFSLVFLFCSHNLF